MNTIVVLMLFTAVSSDPSDDLAKQCKALEMFLQDQEDHKEICPQIKWEQPPIEIYKEKLESQLPEKCKKGK